MADTKQGFAIRAPDGQGRWALWVAVAAAVTGWATAGYLYVRQQHDGNAKASAATASPKAEPKPAPRVAAPPEPSPVQAPFVAKPAAPKPEEPAAAEPLYRGKPAEYWLTVLRGGDRQARFDALHAFAELPPQSKETLDEILRALEEKDSITRRCAVEALARYGPRAKPAPTLLEYLKAEAIRDDGRSIVKAIGQMGPEAREAVPVLAGRLREHSVSMRDADAVALCQIGGEEGVRIIAERVDIKRFKGEPTDPFVEAIGYGGEAAVPQLLKWLETTMEEDGWPALGPVLRAIARVGTPARDAAPHLEKIAASQKTEVRTLALYALLRAAPERVNAETTIPLLIERLGESKREPDPARLALVWYGEKAVPKLMDAFRKPGDVQRDLILSTFQRMGPRAREAVPL
ncbi:MAG: hypothetical protein NTW87_29175, partial [Planctomycetota bacterium]|nr:hypothetical protein [Planctomycetota bacterium]